MGNEKMYWVFFVFCVGEILAFDSTHYSLDMDVIPLSIYQCKDSDPLISVDVNLRNVDDDKRVLDIDITFDVPFTEDWFLNVKLDKWNNGDWDEDFYNMENSMCQLVHQFVPRIWQKMRRQSSPAIEGNCTIQPGHYVVKDFEISEEDYDLPATLLGRYRITGIIMDPSETDVCCHVMEVETNKKS